jgi:hypothetical protein
MKAREKKRNLTPLRGEVTPSCTEKKFVRPGRKGELCDHQPDTCHVFIQWQDPDAGARLGVVDDAALWLRTGG